MPARSPADAAAALDAGDTPADVAERFGYKSVESMRTSVAKWRARQPGYVPGRRGRKRLHGEPTAPIAFKIPVSLKAEVEAAAAASGVRVSAWVIEALRARLTSSDAE